MAGVAIGGVQWFNNGAPWYSVNEEDPVPKGNDPATQGVTDRSGRLFATRRWVDSQGKEGEAGFFAYRHGKVGLRIPEGREFWVPLERLSKPDRQFVLSELHALGKERDADHRTTLTLRSWSDASGRRKVEAALVSISDEQLVLLKRRGDLVTVPANLLSPRDQAYVADQQRIR